MTTPLCMRVHCLSMKSLSSTRVSFPIGDETLSWFQKIAFSNPRFALQTIKTVRPYQSVAAFSLQIEMLPCLCCSLELRAFLLRSSLSSFTSRSMNIKTPILITFFRRCMWVKKMLMKADKASNGHETISLVYGAFVRRVLFSPYFRNKWVL